MHQATQCFILILHATIFLEGWPWTAQLFQPRNVLWINTLSCNPFCQHINDISATNKDIKSIFKTIFIDVQMKLKTHQLTSNREAASEKHWSTQDPFLFNLHDHRESFLISNIILSFSKEDLRGTEFSYNATSADNQNNNKTMTWLLYQLNSFRVQMCIMMYLCIDLVCMQLLAGLTYPASPGDF